MIFGQTRQQVEVAESAAAKKAIFGIRKFALLPTWLTDGRTVWLNYYYEYHDGTLKYDKYNLNTNIRRYLEHSLRHVVLYKDYRQQDVEALEGILNNVPRAI